MIPKSYIISWRENSPWITNAQVEQDLIISRALTAIYSDPFLVDNLAFRGGTAIHKLFFSPQPRYSEDIDLVQIHPGPIKKILSGLGKALSFFPNHITKVKRFNNTMLFRFESEIPPIEQIRLKVEINCYEHFSVLGYITKPFTVENPWFRGGCNITTYQLEELVGTKLRALYQRKKGRDLFDLKYSCFASRNPTFREAG